MDGGKVIRRLRNLFGNPGMAPAGGEGRLDERQLAAAALLIEVATVDTRFDDAERARIAAFVRDRFSLSEDEVEALLAAAQAEVDGASQLYAFTTAIKNGFSYDERVALMESLWEVVYADGCADPFEDQLMRRIGGLICVTDRDRGHARKRAQRQHGQRHHG
jgi:uncharacterized tellurite resistance protein B-like protein